ncbi:hypothetical protein V9T40_013442 [Parthenolecanium corni]|uniref:DUF5641 domain-containing protein n=1 Tax=Parthenolecanium corni TaxID=536013 RepID=A0AAN9T4M7_9HEMI
MTTGRINQRTDVDSCDTRSATGRRSVERRAADNAPSSPPPTKGDDRRARDSEESTRPPGRVTFFTSVRVCVHTRTSALPGSDVDFRETVRSSDLTPGGDAEDAYNVRGRSSTATRTVGRVDIARRSSALRESGVRARARCVKISSSPAAVDDRESAYALRGCLRPRQRFRSTFVFETYVALTPGEYGYSPRIGGVRSSHSTACRSPETRTPYEYGRAAGPLASTDGFRSFGRSGEYATRALSRAPVGLAVPSLPRDTTRRTRVLTARSPLRDGEFEAGRNAAHDERTRDEGGYRTGRAIPGVSGIAARTLARVLERRSLQRRRIGAATRPTRSARETGPPTRPRGTKSTGDARPQNSIARDHSQRARPSPTGKTDTRTLQYTETTPRRTQLGRRRSKSTFVDAERLVYIQYLLALRESKNIVSSRRATLKQPLEGDVVLMVDPSLRRGFWRTAIIDRLIRSGDGQKPRRNDGSTMSTTSPSSGCFSVALLLLTIFLDSLRASRILLCPDCPEQLPIPRTQFEYAY